jgi:hypothetical protein
MADYELTSVNSGAELDTAIGLAETALQAGDIGTTITPAAIGAATSAQGAKADTAIQSTTTGVTGADAVTNIISLTQAEYDAIGSPSASTLYIITDA